MKKTMKNKEIKENTQNTRNGNTPAEATGKKSKLMKTGLVGLAIVAIGAAAYFVYDTFFAYEEVDLFEDTAVLAEGYNGEGYISVSGQSSFYDYDDEYDYYADSDDLHLLDFESTVTYDFDKVSDLSNGDKVTVTASYDKDRAEAAKIRVKEDSKTYTISGLTERFKEDGSDIPDKDLQLTQTYFDQYIRNVFSEYSGKLLNKWEATYFASRDNTQLNGYEDFPLYMDAIILVYSYKVDSMLDGNTVTLYGYCAVEGVNKSTDFSLISEDQSVDEYGVSGMNIAKMDNFQSMDDLKEDLDYYYGSGKLTKLS